METVRASVVLEAANGPVTAAAAGRLREGGVGVIPDILANAVGAIVSYHEWVQNRTSHSWSRSDVEDRLQTAIWDMCDRVVARRAALGGTRRHAAYVEACDLLQSVCALRGIFP